MKRTATDVQRKVLRWIVGGGGQIAIYTGSKAAHLNSLVATREPVIACSVNVLDGLKNNMWIECASTQPWVDHLYRITERGIEVALSGENSTVHIAAAATMISQLRIEP